MEDDRFAELGSKSNKGTLTAEESVEYDAEYMARIASGRGVKMVIRRSRTSARDIHDLNS